MLLSRCRRHIRRNKMIYRIFGFLGFTSFLTGWLQLPWHTIPITASLFAIFYYISSGGWRYLRSVFLTIGRDLRGLKIVLRMHRLLRKAKDESIPSLFSKVVEQFPDKVAMIHVDTEESLTFSQTEAFANQIGNYFNNAGSQPDDVVALFMESSPRFVCYWLGLAKLGVVSALINFNLRGDSLLHCIKVSKAKTVVYSKKLADALCEIKDSLDKDIIFYCVGDDEKVKESINIETLVQSAKTSKPISKRKIELHDKLFYVYTSGTTGFPKAAIIRHGRFFMMGRGIAETFNINHMDINYNPLPLYHSNGGIIGIGQTILCGVTSVIRTKFSASRFIDDCIKYDATCTQYIGETCRYLLAQPPKEDDKSHKLRLAVGNGLRPQIWEDFKTRFQIEQIGEFYGSTEGNSNVINFVNKPGAVGFNSIIFPWIFPLKIVKINEETKEILRGPNGLAIECGYNEPGQIVGKIIKGDQLRTFDGYLNSKETAKKITSNVFCHGDTAFMSGDILYQDELGFIYFHDRTGDTFRWKGENVSTAEVESIIMKILKLSDAVVYGVAVPGTEGKAGMVAVVDKNDEINMKELAKHLKHALPSYAQPVFVRKMKNSVATTSTFKFQKTQLQKDGFNPQNIKDDLVYYFHSQFAEYRLMDKNIYQQIANGKIRL